ncbi:MAG TPA: AmmeMemoRadiSam system protein A [Thermodesulfovibrionales bacterium]|nr:AmmeMemoRadiSam system protein A [Thermodesulfovibrionales bacterium]
MHPVAELAKKSVESYIREGRTVDPPDTLPPEMSGKAGVFVCLKKNGELRGCIGTFSACCDSIAMEIITNAISAATRDPRFPQVEAAELGSITYSVDILSCPEKIKHVSELDPSRYGIIVQGGFRRALLLPDLEGVDTVEEQIRITRMKAGILPSEEVEIYKFEVKRYQ